ncbi:Ferric enterobactin transport system permeaseprotein FepG [Salmonella enterica subsp. enterica]|nr:Ferric enterobactin transport system permeaseprotein FepG [Salmonella enterica subsp. enterica]
MAGGIVTSLIVWLLAWRNGIETFRLIIIGIGIRAMLVAFNTWLLLQASLETALTARLMERRVAQRSDMGKNLAFSAADYCNADRRRATGASYAAAGDGR